MPDRIVIAHYMHEHERSAAQEIIGPGADVTESFVLGRTDESAIQALRDAGLIVSVVEEGAAAGPAPLGREAAAPEVAARPMSEAQPTYYTVRLLGPLLDSWRREIEDLGAVIVGAQGGNRITLRLDPSLVGQVSQLAFVESAPRYFTDGDAGRAIARAAPKRSASGVVVYDALLQQPADGDAVAGWLRERGDALVIGVQGRKLRFATLPDSDVAHDLRALPEVLQVHPYVEPELHNDRARVLLGIDPGAGGNPGPALPWTGRGQILGVADTGLDENHPDFQGRIRQVDALGRPGDPSDPHGHGTHVSGSVLGDGAGSGGTVRGTAPEAELYFQSVLDAGGGLGGLPWNLSDLFDPPYQAGVRIHNNSWGAATESEYTVNSIEVDEFVYDHPDFLVIISAGNEGTARNPRNSQPGFVDWLSIGSPASCKNALTVGASQTDRTSGGLSQLTYGQAWPGDFPAPPIANLRISGAPEDLAGFSSRGPCTDRRIKPDIVAPGTDIVSAKSATAPLGNFWGAFPGHGSHYAYMGGTSMAAPVVAGCAALVRQYYQEDRNHDPSAALLKATLINGARWLGGPSSVAEFVDAPNFHQGFGCVDMRRSLAVDGGALEFVDTWQEPNLQFTRTGERVRWSFDLDGNDELRLCLTWTDPPARALQNNLNLFLQLPDGSKRVGNESLPLSITGVDPENNVEVIRIANAPPGGYLIQVSAANLVVGQAQAFALVVTGRLTTGLQPA